MINLHQRVAILIDGDNVDLDFMAQVLKISEYYGQLEICRAYRDWRFPGLSSACKKLDALKIERIQVDQVGDNATDHRLLFEAGGILGIEYPGDVHVFVVVSGDGDFASACKFIRESGRELVVIGHRKHTSRSLRANCDKFYFLEALNEELKQLEELHPIPPNDVRRFFDPLFHAYHSLIDKKYDWVSYNQLEAKLREIIPDYEREFGKYKLSEWLRNFSPDYEINENAQMIRRVDTNPDETRRTLLLSAYLHAKGPDDLAFLGKLGKAAHDRDFNNLFDGKRISAWLKAYPGFEIRGDQVIYINPWQR